MSMRVDEQSEGKAPGRHPLRLALKIILPIVIIAAGFIAAGYIQKTAPKARKNRPAATRTLVDFALLRASDENIRVTAMGKVIPAREIALRARLSGEIARINPRFTEGGLLKKGEEILRLDASDYELAEVKAKGAVARARYELEVEMGHQDVAKREWALLNRGSEADGPGSALALRKPHLDRARAELEAARAELKQAGLNLERTILRAPFNAVVLTKEADLGSRISTQDRIATLVDIDEYRIQVSLPVDRLKWLTFPGASGKTGSAVTIRDSNGEPLWRGRVKTLLGDIESDGLMAKLLVSVPDPYGLTSPSPPKLPLLIGRQVQVEIEGTQVKNIFKIPRPALREDDFVWIADEKDNLQIRPVEVLWRDRATVFIKSGVREGERLITSDIPTPVEALPLRIGPQEPAGPETSGAETALNR